MTQYKGVGEVIALDLLVNLPELGALKNKQIAALEGVAPFNKDSGKKTGQRTTKGSGRLTVKRIIFTSALSAIKWNEQIHNFYQRLLSAGKRRMVAMTACMRKILIHLNAILRDGEMKIFI